MAVAVKAALKNRNAACSWPWFPPALQESSRPARLGDDEWDSMVIDQR